MNNKDREPSHGTVPFVDNRGIERLRLPDNLTLGQLAVMGITLRLEPKDSNHEDGKIVHNPAHYPKE